ncbi:TrmJ/YjtD family RNA methyltransferase [Candidatus Woesearchaeota archaeon]|nr:TrmJ/YjtD family RNA methyltransferase [Candidatus Woesearchaeota archaeon]
MKLTIILQEIGTPGNLGAIARIMANFDISDLILVKPKLAKEDIEEIKRAKHAQHILKKAKILKKLPFKDFDYLIGTTARLSNDYNLPRSPLTVKQLAAKLHPLKHTNIGLWIGREGDGLTNNEIKQCDFVVSIPASKKYPSLNISHAVGIILYELFQSHSDKSTDRFTPATITEKQVCYRYIKKIIETIDFSTPEKKQTQLILWKKILGKSFLTRREAFALIGFFKKLL